MAAMGYKHLNTADSYTCECSNSSCANLNILNYVHADFGTVCAFLLALVAIITGGAIISVIISVAIICIINVIIRSHNRTGAREVYTA